MKTVEYIDKVWQIHILWQRQMNNCLQLIDNSLVDNYILASLTQSKRRNFIDTMVLETAPVNTIIIQQGIVGNFFYVVE